MNLLILNYINDINGSKSIRKLYKGNDVIHLSLINCCGLYLSPLTFRWHVTHSASNREKYLLASNFKSSFVGEWRFWLVSALQPCYE